MGRRLRALAVIAIAAAAPAAAMAQSDEAAPTSQGGYTFTPDGQGGGTLTTPDGASLPAQPDGEGGYVATEPDGSVDTFTPDDSGGGNLSHAPAAGDNDAAAAPDDQGSAEGLGMQSAGDGGGDDGSE